MQNVLLNAGQNTRHEERGQVILCIAATEVWKTSGPAMERFAD
jgi:hypothetical protein